MGIGKMKIGNNRAVFLDRDGVINKAVVRNGIPFPPDSLNDLVIPAENKFTLEALQQAGFILVGITNQPDVARGKQKKKNVEEINQYIKSILPVTEIYVCYHDDIDHCNCRKPLPGLILRAAEIHNINISQSYMIGDRWKDIEAGFNAGCKTIFIDYQYQEKHSNIAPTRIVHSLVEASEWILNGMGETE
jgi:D-glycero-D-manno-heptose 1,7-bisphosphate phosphatase